MSFKIKLDHIGIATPEIKDSNFFKLLGLLDGGTEEVPTEKVKVGFYGTDNGANIELLEPTADDSPIAKFISKRGSGIHHICFRVKNIEQMVEHLKSNNIRLINEEPRVGAHNCRVVFIHPKSTGGVLVELSG
ncbi:MAG: methylmalonyl-CoA epimerase [Pseudomonadota bacterium]